MTMVFRGLKDILLLVVPLLKAATHICANPNALEKTASKELSLWLYQLLKLLPVILATSADRVSAVPVVGM